MSCVVGHVFFYSFSIVRPSQVVIFALISFAVIGAFVLKLSHFLTCTYVVVHTWCKGYCLHFVTDFL